MSHMNSCKIMYSHYGVFLGAFVRLKNFASQQTDMRSYQLKMNLYTLCTSFTKDAQEHLKKQ